MSLKPLFDAITADFEEIRRRAVQPNADTKSQPQPEPEAATTTCCPEIPTTFTMHFPPPPVAEEEPDRGLDDEDDRDEEIEDLEDVIDGHLKTIAERDQTIENLRYQVECLQQLGRHRNQRIQFMMAVNSSLAASAATNSREYEKMTNRFYDILSME